MSPTSNTTTSENNFIKLSAINVNGKTEKKNNLTYLSWAWAVDQLLRQDGQATWTYGEPVRWGDTVMVFCTVIAFGKHMTAQLPVMDHRNKAIPNPDAFQVNVAMQRALAKAISLHGIGLYIYAGEDLPMDEAAAGAPAEKPANRPESVDVDTSSQPCTEEQKVEILELSQDPCKDAILQTALVHYKVGSIALLTVKQANTVIMKCKAKK